MISDYLLKFKQAAFDLHKLVRELPPEERLQLKSEEFKGVQRSLLAKYTIEAVFAVNRLNSKSKSNLTEDVSPQLVNPGEVKAGSENCPARSSE